MKRTMAGSPVVLTPLGFTSIPEESEPTTTPPPTKQKRGGLLHDEATIFGTPGVSTRQGLKELGAAPLQMKDEVERHLCKTMVPKPKNGKTAKQRMKERTAKAADKVTPTEAKGAATKASKMATAKKKEKTETKTADIRQMFKPAKKETASKEPIPEEKETEQLGATGGD